MQNQRPFRNDSLDDLYSRARGHWESVHFLRLVLDELGSRTTAAARNLFQEIAEQVAALEEATHRASEGSKAERPDDAAADLATELVRLRAEKDAAEKNLAELRGVLMQARDIIRRQEQKLAEASARVGHAVYRRVGLDEGCPDFVLRAVRTAYRKQLHPDTRPAHEKAEAERRFKDAEAVFETIYALRKL